MILVDTSVLIDYFKGNFNEKTEKLDYILDNQLEFGINYFIYQELLQGAATEKDFKKLKEYLSTLKFYNLKNGLKSYEDASMIYIKCRQKGITVRSTIDLLIAQTAIENNVYLLHNDKDFGNIASVVKTLKIW